MKGTSNSELSSEEANNGKIVHQTPEFSLTWINIYYYISLPWYAKWYLKNFYGLRGENLYTKILHGVTGQIHSGKITGLLGPSGSGKSILFECLIGRRVDGLSGRIRLELRKPMANFKVAYVPQSSPISGQLTVREQLRFSARLQNPYLDSKVNSFDKIVNNILRRLGLEVCADNLASRCSGGQMKRIAIAMELVTAPQILILDEPTSGLDSSAAYSVIELLKSIAQGTMYGSPVAIIISIHQPSWEVFTLFDHIIMLSKLHGQVIYDGSPFDVPQFLSLNSATYEDVENPADVLMELACGSRGNQGIEDAVSMTRSMSFDSYARELDTDGPSLNELLKSPPRPFLNSLLILTPRCLLISFRDFYLLTLRILSTLGALPILFMIFENSGGLPYADGCPLNMPTNISVYSPDFITRTGSEIDMAQRRLTNNMGNILMMLIYCLFTGLTSNLFSVARDFPMIRSEILNKWYSLEAIAVASLIVDTIISILFLIFFLVLPWYFLSEQELEFWRIVIVCLAGTMTGCIGQALAGVICTSFLGYSFATSVYAAFLTTSPQIILAGYLIPWRDLPLVLHNSNFINVLGMSIQVSLISLYGFERCKNFHMIDRYVDLVQGSMWSMRNTSIKIWSQFTNRTDILEANYVLDNEYSDMLRDIALRYKTTFYNAKGDIGSLAMSRLDYDDADMGRGVFWLFYQLVTLRLIYYLIYRARVYKRQ